MSLAERLAADETVFTAWSAIPDALVAEALAGTAFDAITLDMQHGGHHEDSVLRSLGPIIAAGKPGLVRIPVGRFDMASRALDFGAEAVIAPMVNTVEDARAFAQSMKYPPLGQRSWGAAYAMARRRTADGTAWLATANARTLAFAMIETRDALAAVDDILDVPGIDGVFMGPSDFSIAWTNGATVNTSLEDMMGAIADLARRARAKGKHAGIFAIDPAIGARYIGMGFRLVAFGGEARYLSIGVKSLIDATRAAV